MKRMLAAVTVLVIAEVASGRADLRASASEDLGADRPRRWSGGMEGDVALRASL